MNNPILLPRWEPSTWQQRAWLTIVAAAITASLIGILVAVFLLREPLLGIELAALPLFALMVRYPRQAFYVYIVLYPLIANLRRDVTPLPVLRVNELLIMALFSAVVLRGLLHWPWRVSFGLIDLGLLLWLLTSSLIPFIVARGRGYAFTNESIYDLVGPIKYFLIYRTARAVVQKREHVIHMIKLCLITSVIVALIAIIQKPDLFNIRSILHTYYLTDSEQAYMDSPWRQPDLYRITSTTSSYNVLGGYLSITLIIAIFFAEYVHRLSSLLWIMLVIAIDSLAFILTGNTAGVFGLLAALAVGTICLRRIPRALPPIIAGVVLALLFFGTFVTLRLDKQYNATSESGDSTLVGRSLIDRISIWREEMLPALQGKYLLGVGPDLPDEVWRSTEESQYLYLLFKGGVLNLSGYLAWTGLVIVTGILAWRSADQLLRILGLLGVLIVLALLFMGISNAYITFTSLMTSAWIVLALVSSASQWAQSKPDSEARGMYV